MQDIGYLFISQVKETLVCRSAINKVNIEARSVAQSKMKSRNWNDVVRKIASHNAVVRYA